MHELCVGHLHQYGRLGHPWVVDREARDLRLGPPVSAAAEAAAEAEAGAPALAVVALTAAATATAAAAIEATPRVYVQRRTKAGGSSPQ